MKLINYLLLFSSIVVPLIEYAMATDDLIQLVFIFEDIDSSLEESSITSQEYFLNLMKKITSAYKNNSYKEVIALITEYARGQGKPGFNEDLIDMYWDEFFPAAALGLLTQYNNDFGSLSISKDNIDSIIEKIVDFFGIDKNLPDEEKLNQLSDRYLTLLQSLKNSPEYKEDIKTIDYQKNIKNMLDMFKIKGLASNAQYEKLLKEIPKNPLESPGYYSVFTG